MAKEKETAEVRPAADAKISYAEALAIVDAENRRRDEEAKAKEEKAKQPVIFRPGKYECTERCYHGRLFEVGEVVNFTNDKPTPLEPGEDGRLYVSHFKLLEE